MMGPTQHDINFRLHELSGWVRGFIEAGNQERAVFWSLECCRISKTLSPGTNPGNPLDPPANEVTNAE